ncbi:MAG TPA: hypothetical protein PLK30_04125, partial [Blastocatellia bacterium]|nr:hypothetical protein [Blastocatellia bacterium]
MFFYRKAALALLLIVFSTGCNNGHATTVSTHDFSQSGASTPTPRISTPTESPKIIASSVTGLIASLEDETKDLPDGKMAWVTFWKLCWKEYPEATEYELETFTGEGSARKLRRQAESCFRVEVAKGKNEKSKGFFNRELMLASISGQLAYRVRAVLAENRVTLWSPLMDA